MKITVAVLFYVSVYLFTFSSCSSSRPLSFSIDDSLATRTNDFFSRAASQYQLMMQQLPKERFPKNFDPKTKTFETTGSDWWCSGFYPGTLLYLYEQTKEQTLYDEAMRMLQLLEKEKKNTSTHDLGFMMFCSFGNAERIAPKPEYRDILIQSARSLTTRFNPVVGCIKSWDSKPEDFLVIIDNMMNLELLFYATRVTGDSSFHKIAVTHANNTIKNHFRPDNSSWHVLNYDPKTGKVKQKRTAQGFSDASAWARGQAWGLYGYTATYRKTGEKKYLEQAEKIAEFILNHRNLPADKVPYWDFNAPDIPVALRDASAAAITASALFELCRFATPEKGKKYFTAAEDILKSLSSSRYQSAAGTNGGFLIQHCVGHLPAGTEVDVSLTYADYYFTEAMIRYRAFSNH